MLNTQDLSDISTSEDTLQEHTTQSVIEIQTDSDDNDDDDDDDNEDEKIESNYYDDSLTAHQFKRKLLLSPQKIKRRNTELIPSRTNKSSLSTTLLSSSLLSNNNNNNNNRDFLKTPVKTIFSSISFGFSDKSIIIFITIKEKLKLKLNNKGK